MPFMFAFQTLFHSIPGLFIISIVPVLSLWAIFEFMLPLVRTLYGARKIRGIRGEKMHVTEASLTWECGEARKVLEFIEIRSLCPLPEPPFLGGLAPWRVRTENEEVVFYANALLLGKGLPAIIYHRSPRLWVGKAPIASPS